MLNAEISLFRTHLSYAQMQGTVYSSMVSLYEGMGVGSVGDAERVTARMRGANGAPVAPEVGTPAGGKGTVP
jgi:multidrug efflux system outer membrane protein